MSLPKHVNASATAVADLKAEAFAVGIYEGELALIGQAAEADQLVGGVITAVLRSGDFKGKANQTLVIHTPGAPIKRILLVGLGKLGELTLETLRQASGKAATTLRDLNVKRFTLGLAESSWRGWSLKTRLPSSESLAQAVAEGAQLALYQMTAYRTKEREEIKAVESIDVLSPSWADATEFAAGLAKARILAESITLVRDLVMHPGNVVTATRLANDAKTACEAAGIKVTILEKADMEKLGFGGVLGVNRGSVEPPKFIVMEYNGGPKDEAPIAIIGKGITFDTGGISIKPSENMDKMKYDMAGGAATIGILCAAARLKLGINIVGLVPATDNMPSGSAIKPGDVLTTYSGQTVEVLNTDAEGRLVLCDAITYAIKDKKAKAIVDMATLTGACVVALGMEAIAVLGNQQWLVDRIIASGETTGDRGWQMPLWKEYNELLKSDIADMKNIGGKEAGTITASCFLQRFAGDTPWCHLDIAGTAWTEKEKPYRPKGPTGTPVRMVVDMLAHWRDPAPATNA